MMCLMLSGCSLNEDVNSRKQLIFGTTLSTKSLDPANGYSGWFLVRYGVGETLFKLNNEMKIEEWLSSGYEYLDSKTLKIYIKNSIKFHNGKSMTPETVKASLERSIEKNVRAASDLKVERIDAGEDYIIIRTKEENPTLINELCEPFASIIDVDSENIDIEPIGTGPFKVEKFNQTGASTFSKNEDYWGGKVKLDLLKTISITDSDMLSMALQSGEIDAAQGLSYSTVELFEEDSNFKVSTIDTSRAIVLYFNEENEILKNKNARKAVNAIININKEMYCTSILKGQASPAAGMFPENINYALKIKNKDIAVEDALNILREEGYNDLDNDGVLEKGKEKLSFKLVTYSSRAELPAIAQAVQNDLKNIGIDVTIDIQDNIADILSAGDFDLALYSNITSSTGDAEAYLSNAVKTNGTLNYGKYSNEEVDELISKMGIEFNKDIRDKIAINVQDIVAKDEAYNFLVHMRMSFVMKNKVVGLTPHVTDYYQFNSNTDIE